MAVANDAAAEAGAEGDAEEVPVTFGAAGLLEEVIDIRQEAGNGFAINEEVAVIVDEHRDAESFFEHWPQGHAATEARQVAQVADNAVGIVGRPWESEANGGGRFGAGGLEAGESFDDVGQAEVEVVAIGRHRDGLGHRPVAADGREAEVGSPRVEGHNDA